MDTGASAFTDALKADLTELQKLYHSAAEAGNKAAMHRLETAIGGVAKILSLYGISIN